MVRQLPVVLLQTVGKQRLQHYRHAVVQRLALGRQQTAVGYLLRQRMLEEIGCLWWQSTRIEELSPGQGSEMGRELPLREPHNLPEQLATHFTPNDGPDLEDIFRF